MKSTSQATKKCHDGEWRYIIRDGVQLHEQKGEDAKLMKIKNSDSKKKKKNEQHCAVWAERYLRHDKILLWYFNFQFH